MKRDARIAARAVVALCFLLAATASADPAPASRSRPPPTASEVLARGRAARRELMRMLAVARSQRDVIKATCYDGKLSELNATIRFLQRTTKRRPLLLSCSKN